MELIKESIQWVPFVNNQNDTHPQLHPCHEFFAKLKTTVGIRLMDFSFLLSRK